MVINGHLLEFPMSYEEIKAALGEARLVTDGEETNYYYDELGLEFDGSLAYRSNLKKICDPLGIDVEPLGLPTGMS